MTHDSAKSQLLTAIEGLFGCKSSPPLFEIDDKFRTSEFWEETCSIWGKRWSDFDAADLSRRDTLRLLPERDFPYFFGTLIWNLLKEGQMFVPYFDTYIMHCDSLDIIERKRKVKWSTPGHWLWILTDAQLECYCAFLKYQREELFSAVDQTVDQVFDFDRLTHEIERTEKYFEERKKHRMNSPT